MASGIFPGMRLAPHLTLVQALGQGAMGKVWLADDARHGRVAVKFLAYGRQRDPLAIARFEREFATASTIESPHVVRMIELGNMADGVPYIVMELLEGENLEERLERPEVALKLQEIVAIVRQVGHALDAAHVRGIVHRDVKPENIVLLANRESMHVKVLDFGLAKPWLRHTLTGSGVAMGTPDYMSPEQVLGGKHVDHRADLWALAVITYRLLCGDFPFQADSVHALMFIICRGQFARPSSFGAPEAFDRWFEHAFHPNIKHRFNSAAEMCVELDRATDMLDDQSQTAIMGRAAMHALGSVGESDDGKTRVRRPAPRVEERHEAFDASDDEKTMLRQQPESIRGLVERSAPNPANSRPASLHPAPSHPANSHPATSHPATSHPASNHPAPSNHPPSIHPASVRPRAKTEDAGVGPMLALIVAAMALGFGVAAAWKHRLFDDLLAAAGRNADPKKLEAPPERELPPSSQPSATPAPLPPPPPEPSTAASVQPDAKAFLTVRCTPGCGVWIGRKPLGLSPVVDAPVPPGKHRVVVYRDKVGSKVLKVDIEPGERVSYDISMSEGAPAIVEEP